MGLQGERVGAHAITPERMGSPYDQLSMANEYFMKSHILWPVSQRPLSA
jgi:hypothetical protein